MANYARLAATATRLITANGVPITLTKPRTDDYDPTLGTADALSPTTFDGFAVSDELVQGETQSSNQGGSRIRAATQTLYATLDATADPQSGDGLTIDGDSNWIVDTADIVKPGPSVVLFVLKAKTV